MNIVLKTSLKNIFGKPLRTFLVVFSIFVCSICAMLCFDLVSSMKETIGGSSLGISKANCLFTTNEFQAKGLPDGFPECELVKIDVNTEQLYKDIEGEYNYVTTDKLGIYGLNIDAAVNMDFIEPVELGLYETVITGKFAEQFGYKVGDKLIVHDKHKNEVELTITGISSNEKKNYFISNYTAIVNEETSEIISCGIKDVAIIIVDVLDEEQADRGLHMIQEYYPNSTVMNLTTDAAQVAQLNQMVLYFYLVFAIAFLLVIFVTTSICNRIVSERMPFIGTLRSLGMSNARTGRILLLENTLYALLGSIPGVIVYGFLRVPILRSYNNAGRVGSSFKAAIPPMSALVIIGVIIGAVIVECFIPMKAILKALKTSIRDIIFDNRDTAYRFSRSGLIIGLVFVVIAVIAGFFSKNLVAAIICLLFSVTSLALLFPWILRGITNLTRKLADKKESSKWSLASVEVISRKSTVGSGVLCVTAAAMCVIVFSFVQSALLGINTIYYSSDVILSCNKDMNTYSFVRDLDGVNEIEPVYMAGTLIQINDEVTEYGEGASIYALNEGGFKYYNIFEGLPDTMENGSILISEKYAEKKGLNIGDTVRITYSPSSVLPIIREYKIASFFEMESFGGSGSTGTFFLSERDYKEIFKDKPGMLMIKCDDPDYVANMIRTYAVGNYSDVQTLNEIIEDQEKGNAQLKTVVIIIILVAVGMTFIGMVSNQLIGFEGRKKECAVMLSTAMDRGNLSGILFREMLITALSASFIGTVIGVIMVAVINIATSNNETMTMDVETNPGLTLLFCVLLVVAFTATVLFPIAHLKKMKIAEQIKYE